MRAPITSPLPFARVWGWVVFVALLFLLNFMARSALSPVLVDIERDLQAGHAQATSLLFMQGLGFALSQAATGFLAGRIPPVRILQVSMISSGLCLLGMLWVRDIQEARGLFLLFGGCAGLYFPAAMATLGSLVRPADWGKAVGIHELAPNLGFILIPLLAQGALHLTHWRGFFACLGAATCLLGLAFLRYGQGGRETTAAPSLHGSAEILRNPAAWALTLLLIVAMSGEFSVFSVLPLFLVNENGFAPASANGILSLTRIATPLAVLLGGWLADRRTPLPTLRVCLVLHTLALLLLNAQGTTMLAAAGLQAMTIAVAFPVLFKAISGCFALDKQPILFSLTMPLAALTSNGIMPWFFGLCGQYLSFRTGFMALAVLSALSVLCLPLLRPRAGQAKPRHRGCPV